MRRSSGDNLPPAAAMPKTVERLGAGSRGWTSHDEPDESAG
jgi:hypothetical protein